MRNKSTNQINQLIYTDVTYEPETCAIFGARFYNYVLTSNYDINS